MSEGRAPEGAVEQARAVESLGYEQARDELAGVVATLEAGGLSLDDSLALWERGEALARRCEDHLAGARERVSAVLERAEEAEAGAAPSANGGPAAE